jgi:uracil phosphoribosyltransferase
MMERSMDVAYRTLSFKPQEIRHHYGPRVHILSDPVLVSRVLKLSLPETRGIEGGQLLSSIYRTLMHVAMAAEFPRTRVSVLTRMGRTSPDAVWSGQVIDADTRAVTVGVARAGLISSQVCFEEMGLLLGERNVRQDFLMAERRVDRRGRVRGAQVSGAKVGGSYADRIVIFPDPMGATGGSLDLAIRFVRAQEGGQRIRKILVLNLVTTPEFIRRLHEMHPDVIVYAARLDRGRSAPKALHSAPGSFPKLEAGLNERSYIIPGLGGLGEFLNNAEH